MSTIPVNLGPLAGTLYNTLNPYVCSQGLQKWIAVPPTEPQYAYISNKYFLYLTLPFVITLLSFEFHDQVHTSPFS